LGVERTFEHYEAVLKHEWKSIAHEADIYRIIWEPDDYESDHPHEILSKLKYGREFLLQHASRSKDMRVHTEFLKFIDDYICAIQDNAGSYICID